MTNYIQNYKAQRHFKTIYFYQWFTGKNSLKNKWIQGVSWLLEINNLPMEPSKTRLRTSSIYLKIRTILSFCSVDYLSVILSKRFNTSLVPCLLFHEGDFWIRGERSVPLQRRLWHPGLAPHWEAWRHFHPVWSGFVWLNTPSRPSAPPAEHKEQQEHKERQEHQWWTQKWWKWTIQSSFTFVSFVRQNTKTLHSSELIMQIYCWISSRWIHFLIFIHQFFFSFPKLMC